MATMVRQLSNYSAGRPSGIGRGGDCSVCTFIVSYPHCVSFMCMCRSLAGWAGLVSGTPLPLCNKLCIVVLWVRSRFIHLACVCQCTLIRNLQITLGFGS